MINELSTLDDAQRRAARDLSAYLAASLYASEGAYSEESKNIARGLTLIRLGNVQFVDATTVKVRSGSDPSKTYTVTRGGCECKAVEYRGSDYRCAHRWAANLTLASTKTLERLYRAAYKEDIGFAYDLGEDKARKHRVAFFKDGSIQPVEISRYNPNLILGGHIQTMMLAPPVKAWEYDHAESLALAR